MRSREKILAATIGLIRNGGFEKVSIAAVASAAQVTRQTVYSNFGSLETLTSQALAGVAAAAMADIRTHLGSARTPTEYVVEMIVAGRAMVRADPVLALLVSADRSNPLFDTEMMTRALPVVREMLAPLARIDPELERTVGDIAQIAYRLALSVVLFDDESIHSDDDLRAFLTRWLSPALSAMS
ncbi:TetR/AcrR family transcriptional regulator [Nocardia wallacei]|uniref:TetR/AcrR family transcriptional regulator n=1 Tax=Nocardia wallacei TaxID=480035 RepID=UPI0024538EAB|nr:TetR/AcrR family transcriptional regulator [Nocardia wallacei]